MNVTCLCTVFRLTARTWGYLYSSLKNEGYGIAPCSQTDLRIQYLFLVLFPCVPKLTSHSKRGSFLHTISGNYVSTVGMFLFSFLVLENIPFMPLSAFVFLLACLLCPTTLEKATFTRPEVDLMLTFVCYVYGACAFALGTCVNVWPKWKGLREDRL